MYNKRTFCYSDYSTKEVLMQEMNDFLHAVTSIYEVTTNENEDCVVIQKDSGYWKITRNGVATFGYESGSSWVDISVISSGAKYVTLLVDGDNLLTAIHPYEEITNYRMGFVPIDGKIHCICDSKCLGTKNETAYNVTDIIRNFDDYIAMIPFVSYFTTLSDRVSDKVYQVVWGKKTPSTETIFDFNGRKFALFANNMALKLSD